MSYLYTITLIPQVCGSRGKTRSLLSLISSKEIQKVSFVCLGMGGGGKGGNFTDDLKRWRGKIKM